MAFDSFSQAVAVAALYDRRGGRTTIIERRYTAKLIEFIFVKY
jgi:hypothetical protein